MAETVSPPAPTDPPHAPARRDVRVVTPDQLAELRREQQEIYHSLRLKGFGPSEAAREIGIPRALAEQWERPGTAAPQAPGSQADPARVVGEAAPGDQAASAGQRAPSDQAAAADPPRVGGQAAPGSQVPPADSGGSSLPVADRNDGGAAEIRRLAEVCREAWEVARRARVCAERLEHEIALLREHLGRLEAARDGTPPSGKRSIPSRAARSSLTAVLLARGRARQHPAPPPRG